MGKQELAMQVLQQVVKLPMVKVDREKFLVDKFSKELDRKDIATLLEKGPTSLLTRIAWIELLRPVLRTMFYEQAGLRFWQVYLVVLPWQSLFQQM